MGGPGLAGVAGIAVFGQNGADLGLEELVRAGGGLGAEAESGRKYDLLYFWAVQAMNKPSGSTSSQ